MKKFFFVAAIFCSLHTHAQSNAVCFSFTNNKTETKIFFANADTVFLQTKNVIDTVPLQQQIINDKMYYSGKSKSTAISFYSVDGLPYNNRIIINQKLITLSPIACN